MTGRARAADVVLLLHVEAARREENGDPDGAERLRITTTTLRSWVHRGHITRGDGGYSLVEVLAYLDRRQAA
ncbi:hypothetical protein [Amycolatopsis dendrobii]|uniref:Helix-turn-helix domain-containing protein n=1 Tax=Amycolatopsis dendrobii TaxID=2760662 RepID=A0A7W3VVH3_9PSEU|nr:hypothetical protein [Amycolatopsis dendrobii]MBB1153984.1 hypothetical protein [Amycolatopsis dendrobii]